jgi:hypothetical protein
MDAPGATTVKRERDAVLIDPLQRVGVQRRTGAPAGLLGRAPDLDLPGLAKGRRRLLPLSAVQANSPEIQTRDRSRPADRPPSANARRSRWGRVACRPTGPSAPAPELNRGDGTSADRRPFMR